MDEDGRFDAGDGRRRSTRSSARPERAPGRSIKNVFRSFLAWPRRRAPTVRIDARSVLGITDTSDVVRDVNANQKGTYLIRTLGGRQKLVIVSTPGLDQQALTFKKLAAGKFQDWVKDEVLPSTRSPYSRPPTGRSSARAQGQGVSR